MIGDCETVALVSREGTIDWLCRPSFSSAACFAALMGTRNHGFWKISTVGRVKGGIRVLPTSLFTMRP
ncbi:MAG: trehalase-like domain-containing protein [Edaphobacter sp.]